MCPSKHLCLQSYDLNNPPAVNYKYFTALAGVAARFALKDSLSPMVQNVLTQLAVNR